MRIKKRKKNALFIFLLFNSLFLYLIFINSEGGGYDPRKNEKKSENNKKIPYLKNLGYWNLTGFPIYIDNYNPHCNWKKIASEHEWCSGSGTLDDPYIIEKVIINGKNSGSCVTIRNSDVYFIIKNCILYNSGWSIFNWGSGIKLINTNNGRILDNNCSYNNGYGILQFWCSNNNFSGNILNYNTYHGIFSWQCDENYILDNEINYNKVNGLYFWFSDKNNISNNAINHNLQGINLIMSDDNYIAFNYLVENNVSIYQFWSYGNIIKDNKYEYELPIPEEPIEIEKNDDEDDNEREDSKTQEIPYISLIIIGTSLGLVSGGIMGYFIQKKRLEKKSLFLFGKPLKKKPKIDESLNLEEKVDSRPEFEFVPKAAIMKFEDVQKVKVEQESLKNNLSEKEKK